ncbi:hypothetical protein MBLNU13_g09195t2 [Cladosporium sp. NU13]
MAFLGDDEWDYRPRRPSARQQHSYGYNNLDPNAYRRQDPNGLHRTRSTGHSPAPIVNVYNDVYQGQDANMRADAHSPPQVPMPPYPAAAPPVAYPAAIPGAFPAAVPQTYPVPVPVPVPEYRDRDRGRTDRLGADLAEELAEMRLERRMRSRSRGRSDASSYSSDGRGHSRGRSEYYKHELDRLERERREDEQKEAWKREEARIKSEMEIKRLKDEAKRAADDEKHDAERKRVIEEYERKQREAKEKAKADEIRYMEKREREKREAKEEEQRFIEKMEREKREAKEEERRVIEKVEREKREAKEREDREWAEFERRRKEKEEKEAKEKKEAQAKLDEAMRKRLAETGFTQSQIDAIMDKEKKKQEPTSKTTTTTTTTTLARVPLRPHVPVYAKIHVDYISTETLRYYDIPWEYDRGDPSYIIILREMDKHETNILFDHTKRLREGRLLLEAPSKEKRPEYAFYRKRSKSRARDGSGEWKKFGILEDLIFINLNYKGTSDAVREKAHAIGEFINHELINYDGDHAEAWCDHVIHKTSTTLYPLRSFAIFVSKYCTHRQMISSELGSAIFCGKHTGWNGRHGRFPSVLAQWEMVTTSPSTQHEQRRIEKDWNEHYYVVVGDGLMDDAEVEIVSVKSQKRWKWSISNFCEILHYITIGLITEEELSSPWKAQPELLRALSPAWLEGFQDGGMASVTDDSGDDDGEEAEMEIFREIYAIGMYGPEDGIPESIYGPRPTPCNA